MTADNLNPYTASQMGSPKLPKMEYDPDVAKKAETIIKDASQFWLAILMCIVCSGFGTLVVAPWYVVRLVQWNSLAQDHPLLVDPNVSEGSIAAKFQSAKIKLISGIIGGGLLFVCYGVIIAILAATS